MQWYDASETAKLVLDRPEEVTVVQRGVTARLADIEWTMLGRNAGTGDSAPPETEKLPESARKLVLILEVRPLDEQAIKSLHGGTTFALRDAEGRRWTALADVPSDVEARKKERIAVSAWLPPDKLNAVVLDVLAPLGGLSAGEPIPVLRFAH